MKSWCRNYLYLFLCATVIVLLNGCQLLAPVDKKDVKAQKPAPSPSPTTIKAERVSSLLAQAEHALHADRLMQPASNNAYDLYRAVLLLDASNQEALSGIQLIQVRYIELARLALARSGWDAARLYLNRARRLDSKSPLVQEFESHLAIEYQRFQARQAAERGPRLVLSAEWLAENPDETIPLADTLDDVAKRILASREALVIVARSDAEGRWLYKRIKSRLPGYRLRGDIRVEPVPYLMFVTSLD